MNRKAYGILLAVVFLAFSFLTGCGGSSSTTTTPPPPPPSTTNFVFYLSGQDTLPPGSENINYYALAGVVSITSAGAVTAGEQDYNNGFGATSPQPGGDTINGGTLTVSPSTGQGTLTLNTSNTNLGVAGVETLGVQFVNANHALIMQFDGSATSSGSLDLQVLPTALSGSFAFTMAGVDPSYTPVGFGGVFTIGGASPNGTLDFNDFGTVATNQALTVSLGPPDPSGRGTVTSTAGLTGISLNYYIVGPEAVRIIDVDTLDSAVGSAFGQGSGSFTNASLPASVLAISNGSNGFGSEFGVAGQFTTNSTAATFAGVGEDNELDDSYQSPLASAFSGTYSFSNTVNGYGSMTIAGGLGGGDVSALQVYLTDPALNISDPNNTTGGGGGLVLDVDTAFGGGLGVVIPQTDATATDFNGNYAAGWQEFNYFTACPDCEFDMVAQGTMASGGALSLNALVSDPFETLDAGGTMGPATFGGTPLADSVNTGRFTMLSSNTTPNPLTASIGTSPETSFDLVIYQASGGQLFWLDFTSTNDDVFLGPIEQQGTLTGIPAVVKTQTKQK
jgi:hypothetical protein